MPRLTFDIGEIQLDSRQDSGDRSGSPKTGGLESVAMVAPRGFIDSASCPRFERTLEEVAQRSGRFAILDLSETHYINSTGVSAIIRQFGVYRERQGLLVLAAVPKSVGLSMHLLGVTSFIPFHRNVDQARALIEDSIKNGVQATRGDAVARQSARTGKRVFVPLRRTASSLKDARVLLVTPKANRFVRILRQRYHYLNGQFHIYHDADEALSSLGEIQPDVILIDSRMDPSGDFVMRLKMNPSLSLISIIKIYAADSSGSTYCAHDASVNLDFKILENDYLVDPFEILELFSLAEAELLRVPKDRKVFQQQVRFQFRVGDKNIERAVRLSEVLVSSVFVSEEDRTAMCAAIKEGIDNAVVHGNKNNVDKTIDINFLIDTRKMTVIVQDEGDGFEFEYYLARLDEHDNFERAKRRIMEEGHRGGLGIILMHRCTDRIEYSGTGNILRLEKNF